MLPKDLTLEIVYLNDWKIASDALKSTVIPSNKK